MKQIATLSDLFNQSMEHSYRKGNIIFHQGDTLTQVAFIKRGYAKIYTITDDGDQRILLLFGPGYAFPVLRDAGRLNYKLKYFYEAFTDTRIQLLPVKNFSSLLEKHSSAQAVVLDYIGQLSAQLMRRLNIIENKNAVDKVEALLPYLLAVCGKRLSKNISILKVKVTHQDIADMAGVARETASIQLKKLQKEGIIRYRASRMLVITNKLSPELIDQKKAPAI